MVDGQKFKHIQVTPAAEDEVVIHAGAPDGAIAEAKAKAKADLRACGASVKEDAPIAASTQLESAPAGQGADKGIDEPGPRSPATQEPQESEQAYRPTTLDDINSSKMPRTQVIVIALAVVAIAAFVVWYVAFS